MKAAAYIFYAIALACYTAGGWALFTRQGLFGLTSAQVVSLATLFGGVVLIASGIFLFVSRRGRRAAERITIEPRAWNQANGIWVLVITAIVATGGGPGLQNAGSLSVWTVVLVLILGSSAIALARFVKRHGDEIGEARFDTRNPDDRQA